MIGEMTDAGAVEVTENTVECPDIGDAEGGQAGTSHVGGLPAAACLDKIPRTG
jgi:hypothetical protein